MSSLLSRFRHAYLLVALMLLLFVNPILETNDLIRLFVLAILLTATFACVESKRQLQVVLPLTVVAIVFVFMPASADATGKLRYVVILLFFAMCAGFILVQIFARTARVTADTLYGAIAAYLLLGLVWAYVFLIIETAAPGSFAGLANALTETLPDEVSISTRLHDLHDELVGFSFTTLTTLGYGNVAPTTEIARSAANGEAIAGQVYMTVLLARLVAVHISQQHRDSAAPDANP